VRQDLESRGYFTISLSPPVEVLAAVKGRDWLALDRVMNSQTRAGGIVFEALRPYADFTQIEFIISIRSSLEAPDEDGIWHDDGSRLLAFSLSLTFDPAEIEGGRLEIRRRGANPGPAESIPTPRCGTMIVFATGVQGFEHKINRVVRGERIIIAGWCT
jgi:hypothetical protein